MVSINFSRITPNEYRKLKNFKITYGVLATQFGNCLIGVHDNNICHLSLHDDDDTSYLKNLKLDWPRSTYIENNTIVQPYIDRIFERKQDPPLNVLLKGTTFQCEVWMELSKLHEGTTVSYEYVAKSIGKPNAVRAVASAIAKNKVAYIIPCHRVIRKSGSINKYRWGEERKQKMLSYECSL